MTQFALDLFEQERTNHPELSDREIVAIINEQVKYNQISTEGQAFVKSIGTRNQ